MSLMASEVAAQNSLIFSVVFYVIVAYLCLRISVRADQTGTR